MARKNHWIEKGIKQQCYFHDIHLVLTSIILPLYNFLQLLTYAHIFFDTWLIFFFFLWLYFKHNIDNITSTYTSYNYLGMCLYCTQIFQIILAAMEIHPCLGFNRNNKKQFLCISIFHVRSISIGTILLWFSYHQKCNLYIFINIKYLF